MQTQMRLVDTPVAVAALPAPITLHLLVLLPTTHRLVLRILSTLLSILNTLLNAVATPSAIQKKSGMVRATSTFPSSTVTLALCPRPSVRETSTQQLMLKAFLAGKPKSVQTATPTATVKGTPILKIAPAQRHKLPRKVTPILTATVTAA